MTRRDFILKWLWYATALAPILILNLYLLPRFPIFGIIPSLLPIAAITVAVLEGPLAGGGFGLFVGILSDAFIPGLPGSMTLALAILGMGAGAASRYGVHRNLAGCFLCSAVGTVIIHLIRLIYFLLRSVAPLPTLLAVALPEIFWSLVFLPLIYAIFLWVYRRVPQASVF